MKKLFILFISFILTTNLVLCDEGMWIPLLLDRYNISEMHEKGFKLSAEDVYGINQSSIKDAVVRIGGCTGVIVSEQGLVLTNHHCGLGVIQSHSTLENDYLTEGFWAMTREQELPSNLTATILIRMEDVTEAILSQLNDSMSERERQLKVIEVAGKLEQEAVLNTKYLASVVPFYFGNQYFLFVFIVYNDVRMVGAPPLAIGKFGGDTDNWMWPRHSGDFMYFRIYADKNNEPASFSLDNVPFRPEKVLPVSLKGFQEGDFTMVMGYPAFTQQYLTSYAVEILTEKTNPHRINLRDIRLQIMGEEMEKNPTVRIQYYSKFARVSNSWKRWIGENKGLNRLNAVDKKKELENNFLAWAKADSARAVKYKTLIDDFRYQYSELEKLILPRVYISEAIMAIEAVSFAAQFQNLVSMIEKKEPEEAINAEVKRLKITAEEFFSDYHLPVDKAIFKALLKEYYNNIQPEFHPAFFNDIYSRHRGDYSRYANYVYSRSIFTNRAYLMEFLDKASVKTIKNIKKDPLFEIAFLTNELANKKINNQVALIEFNLSGLYRRFIAGLKEMQPERIFYPDANRTLRVAFGQIVGYNPRDAVSFKHYTTLSGIMEKYNPEEYDFQVSARLKGLYKKQDFGIYGVNGTMPVAFIATNHTSGGNSGSPVLNAKGHIIGINFDRVWEGTMSDIMFDPAMCRNISVDIRYVLFLTEKYAGAIHLINEMTIIR